MRTSWKRNTPGYGISKPARIVLPAIAYDEGSLHREGEAVTSKRESLNRCYLPFTWSWCYYSLGRSVGRTTRCLGNCEPTKMPTDSRTSWPQRATSVAAGHTWKPRPRPQQLQARYSYQSTSRYCARLGDFPDLCSRMT